MPLFEYKCRKCSHEFEALVFGSRAPACPECRSKSIQKQLSTFAVGSGGRPVPAPVGGCGSCGDPRGPGACKVN